MSPKIFPLLLGTEKLFYIEQTRIEMRILYFLIALVSLQLHAYDIHDLIIEGSGCNNFFLYEDALKFLNEAIRRDPRVKEAYQERALTYFELDEIDLAFNDYERLTTENFFCNFQSSNSSIPILTCAHKKKSSLDFATGLLQGTLKGFEEETFEFVSSIRGSFSFLWALTCSPVDVSKELIAAVYAMGEFVAHANISDLLEAALPELIECRQYWDVWSHHVRGQKIGYIIGKYSIAAFYYITLLRGVTVFNELKRANIMAILERCTHSKRSRILKESSKRCAKNISILNKAKSGSIIAHNPNVIYHVLQNKHRWNRFIHMTGSPETDFKKVVAFLEKHQILQAKRELEFATAMVKTYRYTLMIEGEVVVATFEVTKNNMMLLRNAWVEVKVPYRH